MNNKFDCTACISKWCYTTSRRIGLKGYCSSSQQHNGPRNAQYINPVFCLMACPSHTKAQQSQRCPVEFLVNRTNCLWLKCISLLKFTFVRPKVWNLHYLLRCFVAFLHCLCNYLSVFLDMLLPPVWSGIRGNGVKPLPCFPLPCTCSGTCTRTNKTGTHT